MEMGILPVKCILSICSVAGLDEVLSPFIAEFL